MITRRDFLKLGALFVPVVAAPTVAYSFLRPPASLDTVIDCFFRAVAIEYQIPENILRGEFNVSHTSRSLVSLYDKMIRERAARFQAGAPPLWPSPYPAERPSARVE